MKNAMKKLTSLLLVAVLLVGVMPFGASAAVNIATSENVITVDFYVDGNREGTYDIDAAAEMSYDALMAQIVDDDWDSTYAWAGYYNSTQQNGEITSAKPGDYVYLKVKTIAEQPSVEQPSVEQTPVEQTPVEPTRQPICWEIKYVEGGTVVKSGSFVPNGETANVKDILYYHVFDRSNDWQDKYECTKAWSTLYQKNVGYEGFVSEGDVVSIVLSPKTGSTNGNTNTNTNTNTSTTETTATLQVSVNGVSKVNSKAAAGKTVSAMLAASNLDYASSWTSYYTVNSVKINGVSYNRVDVVVNAGDAVEVALTRNYSKDNTNKVYLHVYLNGNAGTIAKTLDITGTYLMYDWATDTTEIKNYLSANYYNAADSNGLTIDGLYISTGTFPTNYYGNNYQTAYTADELRNDLENGDVHIRVMLKNAVAKSTATADSSNPKTGDSIYTAMAVMGISAAALAVVMYVYNKKRYTV